MGLYCIDARDARDDGTDRSYRRHGADWNYWTDGQCESNRSHWPHGTHRSNGTERSARHCRNQCNTNRRDRTDGTDRFNRRYWTDGSHGTDGCRRYGSHGINGSYGSHGTDRIDWTHRSTNAAGCIHDFIRDTDTECGHDRFIRVDRANGHGGISATIGQSRRWAEIMDSGCR